MSETLGEALPREMTRVRDEVLPAYDAIGPSGVFASTMMRRDLDAAQKALAEGDCVKMISILEDLRGWRL